MGHFRRFPSNCCGKVTLISHKLWRSPIHPPAFHHLWRERRGTSSAAREPWLSGPIFDLSFCGLDYLAQVFIAPLDAIRDRSVGTSTLTSLPSTRIEQGL